MKKYLVVLTVGVSLGWIGPIGAASSGSHPLSCSAHSATRAGCLAQAQSDPTGAPLISSLPSGYGPGQFHAAYAVPTLASKPVMLAVVAAYHDPSALQDLHRYDAAFGIADPTSFRQINQRGTTAYPKIDAGWALEMSMDIEVAHGMCQNCPLLLVEADSPSLANLAAAVRMAATQGAKVLSNSYGSAEANTDLHYNADFTYPGTTVVASSGDSGYGTEYPAASPAVVAAGGTTLNLDAKGQRMGETAWVHGGSGCSRYETKPTWQRDHLCLGRSVADVAADADPATGAAIYDSTTYQGRKGWYVLGGTSLAAPLIAGMYGLAGGVGPQNLYAHSSSFYDVKSGANGSCSSQLCRAGSGYDGPTGLGSPLGLGSFK